MENLNKYNQAFVESLSIDETKLKGLKFNEIPEWDSIGHMSLMSELEEEFNISLETEDIVEFGSFKKGIEILEKYKVKF
mgnify:CR=1 FL=1